MKQRMSAWEKRLTEEGRVITWEHDEIVDYLLTIYNRDKDHLLTQAAADDSKQHGLTFVLDYEGMGGVGETNFGGTVHYNKKRRIFDYITYSDRRNWAVMFSITSKAAWFAYEHYTQLKKVFPFGARGKKLTEYLLNN